MIRLIVRKQSYGGCELNILPTTSLHSFTQLNELESFLRTEESMCSKELIGYELIKEAQHETI